MGRMNPWTDRRLWPGKQKRPELELDRRGDGRVGQRQQARQHALVNQCRAVACRSDWGGGWSGSLCSASQRGSDDGDAGEVGGCVTVAHSLRRLQGCVSRHPRHARPTATEHAAPATVAIDDETRVLGWKQNLILPKSLHDRCIDNLAARPLKLSKKARLSFSRRPLCDSAICTTAFV